MRIPLLPSEEERLNYWRGTPLLQRSLEGHVGIYLTHHHFVLKLSEYPGRELLASKILRHLTFPTPPTAAIFWKSKEGYAAEKSFKEVIEDGEVERFKKSTSYFLTMSRVYGRSLEELTKEHVDYSFKDDEERVQGFLESMGKLGAIDLFLGYQDRFSLTGMSNRGNIMILCDRSSKISTLVAIDQNVALGKKDLFSGERLVDRMKLLLTEILCEKELSMKPFLDDLPPFFSGDCKEKSTLSHLWKGFISGLKLIAENLSQEKIKEMVVSATSSSKHDYLAEKELIEFQGHIALEVKSLFSERVKMSLFLCDQTGDRSAIKGEEGREDSSEELIKLVNSCKKAQKLLRNAKELQGEIFIEYNDRLASPAQWDPAKKVISLKRDRDAIGNLLFELHNAASRPLKELIDKAEGFEAEQFANAVEQIEYDHLLSSQEICEEWVKCGIVERNPFGGTPLPLEDHLALQKSSGHTYRIIANHKALFPSL